MYDMDYGGERDLYTRKSVLDSEWVWNLRMRDGVVDNVWSSQNPFRHWEPQKGTQR